VSDAVVSAASRRSDRGGDLELVRLPVGRSIAQAMREVAADGAVEFVEPNWLYSHHAASNDTHYSNGSLWGMYGDLTSPANPYGSQAGDAWANNHTCNADVYIGVIDEGMMVTHEDLAPNVWVNTLDPVNGIDDDGNGFVDDVNGWDFVNDDSSVFDGVSDDHGTHVSGTIAGAGGNGKGVTGVCWSVKLISAKFLGARGGTTANAIRALNYLVDLKRHQGLKLVATSNSWGGGGFSQGLLDAINASGADDTNMLFIVAAGNSGANIDTSPSYPASYATDNMISVAAIASDGTLASFSNYGAQTVDIGAPGVGIISTLPGRSKGKNVSSYGSYNGTSMATPHVSGAAALYASTFPGSTAVQIKAAILSKAAATPSLTGKVRTGGRLNVSEF